MYIIPFRGDMGITWGLHIHSDYARLLIEIIEGYEVGVCVYIYIYAYIYIYVL